MSSPIPLLPPPYRHKLPAEVRAVTFSFRKKLRQGSTLTGTFAIEVEPGLVFSPGSLQGTEVTVMWSGGELGKKYRASCRAPASNGETLVLLAEFGIEERN
jgi:hypothetical protein